jgi:membrane protein
MPGIQSNSSSIYKKIIEFLSEDIWHVEASDLARIPRMLLGLLQFLLITLRKFVTDRGLMMASALTFASLLAFIPFLVLLFTLFSLLGGAQWLDSQIRPLIFDTLATGAGEKISQSLSDLVRSARLGTTGTVSFIFMVVTALGLLNTIESAFNQVWSVAESRSILKKIRDYWSAITIAPILIVVSLFLTTSLGKIPIIQTLMAQSWVDHLLTVIMPLLLQWLAFYLFFLMVPNTVVRMSAAALGALAGSVLWELAKAGYLTYTTNVVKYNLVYGSLAFIPIFMIWVFLTWVAILIGVEISYVYQNFGSLKGQIRRIRLSFSQKEMLGLTVMAEVARRFMKGEIPTTIYEFSHRLKLPAEHLRSVVQLFREQKLLSGGDDDALLVVTRDLDRISVQTILDALREGGGGDLLIEDDALFSAVNDAIRQLMTPARRLLGETTLRKLVARITEDHPGPNGG